VALERAECTGVHAPFRVPSASRVRRTDMISAKPVKAACAHTAAAAAAAACEHYKRVGTKQEGWEINPAPAKLKVCKCQQMRAAR